MHVDGRLLMLVVIELECLRHLRELRADGNRITSLDGLSKMEGLTKLSLQGNRIVSADCMACKW